MEVHLAIPPQDLLTVFEVPKPKGAGAATSSTVLTTPVPVSASTPRVTRATSKKGIYSHLFSFTFFIMLSVLSLVLPFVKEV